MKREIDCPVHFPPLGSPQGCSHFQYSDVSHSEVVCSSRRQIGLTADAAQCQRQNCHSLENIDFVKFEFCCLSSPSHVRTWCFSTKPSFQPATNKSICGLPLFIRPVLTIHLKITGRSLSGHNGESCPICLPRHVLIGMVILNHFSLNSSHSNQQQHHNLVVTLNTFPH